MTGRSAGSTPNELDSSSLPCLAQTLEKLPSFFASRVASAQAQAWRPPSSLMLVLCLFVHLLLTEYYVVMVLSILTGRSRSSRATDKRRSFLPLALARHRQYPKICASASCSLFSARHPLLLARYACLLSLLCLTGRVPLLFLVFLVFLVFLAHPGVTQRHYWLARRRCLQQITAASPKRG